jgi:hypothetical protein
MYITLSNGTIREVPAHSNLRGLTFEAVTFVARDVYELQRLTDVQAYNFLKQLRACMVPPPWGAELSIAHVKLPATVEEFNHQYMLDPSSSNNAEKNDDPS